MKIQKRTMKPSGDYAELIKPYLGLKYPDELKDKIKHQEKERWSNNNTIVGGLLVAQSLVLTILTVAFVLMG